MSNNGVTIFAVLTLPRVGLKFVIYGTQRETSMNIQITTMQNSYMARQLSAKDTIYLKLIFQKF